jgi:hypothetical protein
MNAPPAMNGYTTPPLTPQPEKPPTLQRKIRITKRKHVDDELKLVAEKLELFKKAKKVTDGAEHANELPDLGDLVVAAVVLAP